MVYQMWTARAAERSVVKPPPFAYHRASSVSEATGLLAELGEDAKILAGGQSLVPMMNFRLARPSDLIDITRVPGLSYLTRDEAGLHIGALTTHHAIELASASEVFDGYQVLPASAHWIGHYPIRARGTFGGSIAHADPSAEWCLLAVLLDAEIVLHGPRGRRSVPAGDFFHGFYTTAAEPDEMITEVCFPSPARHAALTEFSYRRGDFAVVAAGVRTDVCDGICQSLRIVLGGVGPLPTLIDAGELAGQPAGPDTWRAAGQIAASQIDPHSDSHASASYRKKLAAIMVTRALAQCAQGGRVPGQPENPVSGQP